MTAAAVAAPGRSCPSDYYYQPSDLDRAPELVADVLYVVGGLYGNRHALDAIEQLAAAERGPVRIIFNGDFHWFDAETSWFRAVDERVAAHLALRGNVESELARDVDIGAGCGCAYPESVDEGTVQRSNEILGELRRIARHDAAATMRLRRLPMHLVVGVGGLRVGVVHGDATALAGWRFAVEALDDPRNAGWLQAIRTQSGVDVFASTHTCVAALRRFEFASGLLTVINNGAAGMPNFARTTFGLISRIATCPSPHPLLYGARQRDVFVDALPIRYDDPGFQREFLARWPEGSAAHASYFRRIVFGPQHDISRARPHMIPDAVAASVPIPKFAIP